jgi:hypothetical protein
MRIRGDEGCRLSTATREAEEGGVNYKPVNFQQKFALFSEQWQPKVIAEMNDYQFKVVKDPG